jgi:hypothetical protein
MWCLECSRRDTISVLNAIIPKYSSFQSRLLLNAIGSVFDSLCSVNREAFFSSIMDELRIAYSRISVKVNAPGNYFVLLDWINHTLLLSGQDNGTFTRHLSDLVTWQSTILECCLAQSQKRSLKVSAIRTTRACLRGIFQQKENGWNADAIESYIRILTTSKVSSFAGCLSIGVVAGVCKRLRKDTTREVVDSSKSKIYEFFIKEIIGSRVSVPGHVMV